MHLHYTVPQSVLPAIFACSYKKFLLFVDANFDSNYIYCNRKKISCIAELSCNLYICKVNFIPAIFEILWVSYRELL